MRLDLADREARRALFARLGGVANRGVVLSEGLLIYLEPEEAGALAEDLAAVPSIQRWLVDIVSPGLLAMLDKQMGEKVAAAKAPFRFAPPEGPAFFEPHGWKPQAVRSVFKGAARYRRLPMPLKLFSWMPESNGRQGKRPWSAVCALARR